MRPLRVALFEAIAAALPIAIIYFAGWTYVVKYLSMFGIDATQVSIDLGTILAYAFVPIKSGGVVAYLVVALLVAGYMMSTNVPKTVRRIGILLVVGGVILLLFVINDASERASKRMARLVWYGEKLSLVPSLAPGQSDDAVKKFAECKDGRRFRQIIALTTEMYVMCRDKYYPCSYGLMFVVSRDGRIIATAEQRRRPEDNDGCRS